MKKSMIVGLILFLNAPGQAACVYFRSSIKLLKCGAPDPHAKKSQDPYPTVASDLPEFDDALDKKPLAQVICSCDYTLSGSDPRCETEQTVERTSATGMDNLARYCRRGDALCRDVCAERLP